MQIREKGYHTWKGELKSSKLPWLPIFIHGIKTAFRKKWSKLVMSAALAPFIIFLIVIYAASRSEIKMFFGKVGLLNEDATIFNLFFTDGFVIFPLLILCIFMGAELISGDLKFNSFPLYFSRPLNRKDYIIGKFSILLFYLLLFTFVAGIILLTMKSIFMGQFNFKPRFIVFVLVMPLIVALFLATYTLTISSISSNTRYVKIFLFAIYLFSTSIGEILGHALRNSYFFAFSLLKNLQNIGVSISGAQTPFADRMSKRFFSDVSGWISLMIIVVICLGMLFLLNRNVKKGEAIVDSGN